MREVRISAVWPSKMARRKSSTDRNAGDALLKKANKNDLAVSAKTANMAD
jgi:hypothetical protein